MLPKNLKYNNKLESAFARNFSSYIQPQNGTGPYGDSQTIIINIPTAQNLVMAGTESVLKFDMEVQIGGTDATYCRLDKAGASGCIQRLRLYHGSQLLEDLDNYGNLFGFMTVLQKSSGCNGKDSILNGFCNDRYCDVNHVNPALTTAGDITLAEYQTASTNTKTNQVLPILAGERLINGASTSEFATLATGTYTKKRTYCQF
jgi:hypothetical protein